MTKLIVFQKFFASGMCIRQIKPSYQVHRYMFCVLLDFSLTVKAATLIFISGCGSAIPSANEGK